VTPRDRLFETAVVDGGALGAAAIDIATRAVSAGYAHDGLASPEVLDLLLGPLRPSGALTQLCGGPPASPGRELMVAGRERTLYCTVLDRGELIIVAAPVAMSIALGWALVRSLIATEAVG
jgi:hypothetical protein